MRKKIICFALMAAMTTTLFAGCENDSKDKNKDSADSKNVEISLGIWPGEDLPEDIPVFEGYAKTMKEKNPNVSIEPDHYSYSPDTFVSLTEAGNCPTIFETWFTEPRKLARQGLVVDVTDELKARGWDSQMSDIAKSVLSEGDKIYGVPRDIYALGIMCNVEIFKEAGLVDEKGVPKFPKTWDELAQTAKTIKDKTGVPGFCLLANDNTGGWQFSNIAWCFGATLCTENEDGTFTSNLNSPEAIEAMKYVSDLKWKYDVLTADPMAEKWETGFQQLAVGGAAMYMAANDAVNQPTQTYKLDVDKLAMGAIPAGPNGDQYSLSGGTPYCFAKNATPEQIKACLDFLEIMGKTPEMNDTTIAGMQMDAANRKNNGVPVIKSLPAWTNEERATKEAEIIEEYKNVDEAMFASYFEATEKEGNLRSEEPGNTQEMYSELTKVIQEVVTNKNADIEKLMNQADENYQKILDAMK